MPLHPKNESVGVKVRRYTKQVVIDKADVETINEGQEVTLVDWGNIIVDKIGSDQVKAKLNLSNTNFKKTAKVTWISAMKDTVPCSLIELDHLLSKKELEDGDEIENCIREVTWTESTNCVGEHAMRMVKKGEKMQIMRKGYYICHRPYISDSQPMQLIKIPDGKTAVKAKGAK